MYLEMPFNAPCFIIENELLTWSFFRFSSADVGPFPHPVPVPSTYYIPVELRSVRLTKKTKETIDRIEDIERKEKTNGTGGKANGDVA